MRKKEIQLIEQPAKITHDFESEGVDSEIITTDYKDDIKYSLSCRTFCRSKILAERLASAGLNKFWCCFECCFLLVDKLVSDENQPQKRMEQTEECMRGCNCWPLPILIIIICIIDLYYFVSFSISSNGYVYELVNSNLAWDPEYKNEYHR